MATSKGFCDSIGKLGAPCQWNGPSASCGSVNIVGQWQPYVTASMCGRNKNAHECSNEQHRPSNGILACIWDHQACMNQCGNGRGVDPRYWPECLLPTCNNMASEPSVAVCTACSGSTADKCTAASCAAGYYPFDASTQKCTLIKEIAPPADPTQEVVKRVVIKLDVDVATIAVGTPARAKFEADFSKDVARGLQINPSRIIINSIRAGSAVVIFSIRPEINGTPISTATITTFFSAPGIAIAGARTTAAVTAASVTAEVVLKPPGKAVPLRPPSPPSTLQASFESSSGVSWAAVVLPILGVLVIVLLCLCFAPGEFCETIRKKIGLTHVTTTPGGTGVPDPETKAAPSGPYVDFHSGAAITHESTQGGSADNDQTRVSLPPRVVVTDAAGASAANVQ
jgi:hypothetical protein